MGQQWLLGNVVIGQQQPTATRKSSIQRDASSNVRRDIEILAFVDRRFAFVEAAFRNNFQR